MKVSKKTSKKTSKKLIKYSNSYYIDSCYNFRKEYDLTRLIYHLKRLGLEEDSSMKLIFQNDAEFIKDKNIKFKDGECYQNYYPPMNELVKKELDTLRPKFMLHFAQFTDRRFFNVNVFLSNILYYENINIVNKSTLYLDMKEDFPEITSKYMKNSFYYKYVYKYEFPKMYILRPMNGSSGEDILYISNEDELIKAIKFYNSHNNFFKQDKHFHNAKVLATEYIMNPLLYKSKKCHFRMYYLVSIINNKFASFLLDYGKILTAKKPYNTKLPFDKEVHDTHLKYTTEDIFFPKDFKDEYLNVKGLKASNILDQMREVLTAVSQLIKKSKKAILYDNQKNGYNIFGVDFMVDDTGTVFLIEINKTPGIEFNDIKNTSIFFNKLFDWVGKCVLEPCFKGTDATKHSTYLF